MTKELKQLEVFGSLEKLEQFNTIKENIIPGTLVFESPAPFWGYYSESPQDDTSPNYIYIAILKTYAVFDIVRAYQKARKEFDFDLDAAKAFIKFNDRFYNVIRLRHISDYKKIKDVQESFVRHGIGMLNTSGNWKNVTTHVSLKKVYCLTQIDEGLYIDSKEANHAYIEIPKALTFEEFAELTRSVRNNWLDSKFDAALGYYLLGQKVVEFVRIYSDKLDREHLEGIKKLYLEKI